MKMADRIRAIENVFRVTLPGEPCHDPGCEACAEDRRIIDAIEAAKIAANEADARFEQAKKAWDWSGNAKWYEDNEILDRYFGGKE